MNRWLIPLLISRCRPNRRINLLLQANLAADDKAVRAWQDWLRLRCIEDATWPEARLLAPLACRIATLDTGSPLRGRLEGLAKAHWTQTQLIIRESASAIDALTDAGIDCLLFKGAAHYAEGHAPERRRIMGDVDILVPAEAIATASDRLCEAGWTGWCDKSKGSPEMLRQILQLQVHNGTAYSKGKFGNIDLHRQVFHFSRRDRELDAALWENARPARLAGRSVLIPSPEDNIVISIAHGVRNGDGDWAIDIDCCVRKRQVEWDRIAHIADRRGLVPAVLAGLSYLKILGSDIPQSALDRLRHANPTAGEYLKYLDETFMRETQNTGPSRLVNGAHRIANLLLPRDRYEYRW